MYVWLLLKNTLYIYLQNKVFLLIARSLIKPQPTVLFYNFFFKKTIF